MSDAFPAAQPHDPPVEVLPDVLYVHGSFRMGPGMTISRNMVALRHEGELTLVNPMRLTADGEEALEQFGTVRHLVRLGCLHGLDDSYCIQRFDAQLWSQAGGEEYPEPEPDVVIEEGVAAPIPGAEFIVFREAAKPECVMFLPQHGGLLLACDGIQHWASTSRCSLLAKGVCYAMGFMHHANIGPFWKKLMTKPGGSLKPDYDRILEKDFDHLIGAHGQALLGGAKECLQATVKRVFA